MTATHMPRHIFDDSLLKHQATYRRDGALHPPEGPRMRRHLASGQTDGSGPSNYATAADPVQRDRVSRWGKGKSPEKARKLSLLDRIEGGSSDRRRTSLDQNDDAAATRNKPGDLLSRISFDDPAEVKVERRDSLLDRIDLNASASDMEIDSEYAENGITEEDEQPTLHVAVPPTSLDPNEPSVPPTAAPSSEPTFSNDPDVLKYRDVLLPMVLANLSRRDLFNPSMDKGKLAEHVKGGLNDDVCRTFGKAMMAAREELQKRKEKDSEARVPHDAPTNVESASRVPTASSPMRPPLPSSMSEEGEVQSSSPAHRGPYMPRRPGPRYQAGRSTSPQDDRRRREDARYPPPTHHRAYEDRSPGRDTRAYEKWRKPLPGRSVSPPPRRPSYGSRLRSPPPPFKDRQPPFKDRSWDREDYRARPPPGYRDERPRYSPPPRGYRRPSPPASELRRRGRSPPSARGPPSPPYHRRSSISPYARRPRGASSSPRRLRGSSSSPHRARGSSSSPRRSRSTTPQSVLHRLPDPRAPPRHPAYAPPRHPEYAPPTPSSTTVSPVVQPLPVLRKETSPATTDVPPVPQTSQRPQTTASPRRSPTDVPGLTSTHAETPIVPDIPTVPTDTPSGDKAAQREREADKATNATISTKATNAATTTKAPTPGIIRGREGSVEDVARSEQDRDAMVLDEAQDQGHAKKVNGTTHAHSRMDVDDRMDVDRRTPEQEGRVVIHEDHRTGQASPAPAPAQGTSTPHREQINSTLPVPGIWQAKTTSSYACVNQCSFYVYERDAVRWNVARRRSATEGPGDNDVDDPLRTSGTTSRVEGDVSMMNIDMSGKESDAPRAEESTSRTRESTSGTGKPVAEEQSKERLHVRLFCLDTKAAYEAMMSINRPGAPQPADPSVIVDKLVHMQSQWPEKGHLVLKLNKQTWLPVDLPTEGSVDLTPHLVEGENVLSFVQLRGVENKIFVVCGLLLSDVQDVLPPSSVSVDTIPVLPASPVDPVIDFIGGVSP